MEHQDFMNEINAIDENKLPKALNVLTILTFIGSGLSLLIAPATPWLLKFSKNMLDQVTQTPDSKITAKQLLEMEESKRVIDMSLNNLTFTLAAGVVGAIACIIGAVMMRKRKKDGLPVYILGALMPTIVNIILMKSYFFKGGVTSVFVGLVVPVLFVVLYSMQRKHLTK